ncbi:GH92 family glycosyl hydrolase [Ferruginibacter albus]|uniref:GH92 family glycosyl hydrolase n=1 Tax=Ferruginibacter albus TaxID=2875540 RepID=UPI001CC566B5|nr:GH92 family glycosyl hydrolase [Ferruginibacter albus]UAY50839.1 GH92 family glycosyl hydrolase [Ferruginibacter albus]
MHTFSKTIAILISGIFCLSTVAVRSQTNPSVLNYLSPEIGGVGWMLEPTRPAMQLPNEMMRMTPIRKDYLDDEISSFPLIVVSHRIGQAFSLLPNTDNVITENSWNKKIAYDQSYEQRMPWHYKTYLLNDDVTVEYTQGKKAGMFRFTFPVNGVKNLLWNTYSGGINNWHFINDSTFTGMQWYAPEKGHEPIKVYVYGRFNHPAQNGTITNGSIVSQKDIEGESVKAYSSFKNAGNTIELRYAISYIDEEQAKKNFTEELINVSFEQLSAKAKAAWASTLGQIQVQGGTDAEKRSFYTALYRCYERMINITEDGKYYSGFDNKVHTDARPFYVDDWTWDTYLALHPLRTILNPAREEDMLQSYVRMYDQSGWMPTFPVLFGDHACMNGFHSSVMLLDAYRKGLRNFDFNKAYEGMRKNSTQATMLPWRNGPACSLDSFYYTNGYFPALRKGDTESVARVHPFEKRQAVAVTLGTCYDDWAVAQMAKDLNKQDDYSLFIKKSDNYKNLWNADKKFFLPKDDKGNWIDIDPKFDGGMGGRDYYDENNGWTYLWQVQEDIPGLINLMGGQKGFEQRLDQLFREGLDRSKYEFWAKFPDASGLVGQYSMGNEPSFFIPYLYNYTDAPWKTQQRVRLLLKTWFDDNIFGIPGDEDGGGMSAFVVFSSMGFYPVTPGKPEYTIGSPVFTNVSISLPNGKTFKVIATNASDVNKYVQSAKLNGKVLDTPFFTHNDIVNGGTLELMMGDKPNKSWGVK